MKNIRILTALTIFCALLAGALLITVARATYPDWSLLRVGAFAMAGAMAVLSVGTAALFLISLKDFKAAARLAYGFLCIGIVLFGLTQVQVALIEYFKLTWTLPLSISTAAAYLLSVIFILLGVRKFTALLEIHSRWNSIWLVVGVALAAAVVSTSIPTGQVAPQDIMVLRTNGAFAIWDGVFFAAAAYLTWLIRKSIGPLYKTGMTWLLVLLQQ